MTTSHVPAPSHEQFTVPPRQKIRRGVIPLFILAMVVFSFGIFVMGAGATWGSGYGEGNPWVFFAGLLITFVPFWAGMTFHKH
jgi:hypothetical protein